ncbi:5374_t:CDS:2 [Entrophospora sp. SA101]|nr:5374_t:CDS:2 [Entrophospora sp. SA101]CAJ0913199.1 9846_t:CDS:2 [Entrophospora sp. SA101]
MAERADNQVCGTLQVTGKNCDSTRTRGQDSKLDLFSTNTNNNSMGCNMPSLDVLCQSTFQESNITRAEEISCKESGTLSREDSKDGTKYNTPPSESKSHVFTTKGKSEEVHVRCVNSLRTFTTIENNTKTQCGSGTSVKSENDADIAESFKYCPDQRAIHSLQASFGKLCRIGTLGGTTWTKKIQTKPCRLVLAHPCITEEARKTIEDLRSMSQMSKRIEQDESLRNNTLMVVDTFKDESSRRHLASSIGCELPVDSDDPKELTYYMTNVAQFGFDHIIIIGEIENGMIFLDCYGRVFQWEEECQMLWPLGNSLEEAMSSDVKNQVPWYWEYDGAVYEFKELLQRMCKKCYCNVALVADNFI